MTSPLVNTDLFDLDESWLACDLSEKLESDFSSDIKKHYFGYCR